MLTRIQGQNTDQIFTNINGGSVGGFRNRIINGSCNIAQRGSSFVVSTGTAGYGGPDRFSAENGGIAGGQFTQNISSLNYQGVAKNTVRQTVDAVPTSLTTINYWGGIHQKIEGVNCYDVKGNPLAVSFIFNTNVTGTYSVSIGDGNGGYSFVSTFSATSNTPTKVIIKVPIVPSLATVPATNALGLEVYVGFQNQGAYQTSTLNVWQSGGFYTATGSSLWAATAGNFIELTELQLEVGPVATPFERRPYGLDLILCKRYFTRVDYFQYTAYQVASNGWQVTYPLPVSMRTIPTLTGGAINTTNISGTPNFQTTGNENNLMISGGVATTSAAIVIALGSSLFVSAEL